MDVTRRLGGSLAADIYGDDFRPMRRVSRYGGTTCPSCRCAHESDAVFDTCDVCGAPGCTECLTVGCGCENCEGDGFYHDGCLVVVGKDKHGKPIHWLRSCIEDQIKTDEEQAAEMLENARRLRAALEGRK
jgi:hypothetical protein